MDMITFAAGTLVLILTGMPISYALGLASMGYMVMAGIPPVSFVQHLARGVNSFTLLALPFFILAGQLMNQGGITDRIIRLANALVGHIRGGLAHASILGSVVFASISGSAVASAGALGTIQLEALEKNGYDKTFSVGLIAGAMTIGPIIPPSVIMVVYGIAASVSIGELFVGGIVPGIIMGLAMMILVSVLAHRRNLPKFHDVFHVSEVVISLREAIWALLAPAIIIGGIIGGVFTATEAGAVGALYSLFVGLFIYRQLTLKAVFVALVDTMMLSTSILLIMGMSSSFGWVMAFEQVPAALAEAIQSISQNRYVVLTMLMGFYLVLGCFLEAIAIVVMTIPVVFPVIVSLGIDPIHFGVILAINMSLGTITPPLGIVMYVMTDLARISVPAYAKSILPFLVLLLGVLVFLTLVPSVTTALPEWLF